ncbi:MAG: NHL repeat-containing protein [Thermoanaerobaculia bacterium]|nr:NHL repeat-containing protein [Thermoanaerobaculia bacterium]
MNTRRRLVRLATFAVALATAGAVVRAAEPVYLKRLSLPVAGDDIAYGHCVTADPHTGEVFVCDPRTNRILIFDRDGNFDFQILGGSEISSPEDLAVDPDGLLLVVARRGAGQRLIELDFDGLFRREIELVGLPAGMARPEFGSLALSPAGDRVYVTDSANQMLWIADREGLVLSAVDLAAGEPAEERRNWGPGHVDAYGDRVVVTFPMQGQVRVYSASGELLGAVGVHGSGPKQLGYPTAAAIDDDGDVLVLDSQRMMVSRWRLQGNRFLSEHLGLGNLPGYLYFPYDLALDPRGRFYVAQSADGRVQVYEGLGAAPAPPAR